MRYHYEEAIRVAEDIKRVLTPFCSQIIIAGSLRRKLREVGDIEILLIESSLDTPGAFEEYMRNLLKIEYFVYRLNKKGHKVYGRLNKLLVHYESEIPVDIFSTTAENWWVSMVVRTGPKESNIAICEAAKEKGLKFNAYGPGFTREDGTQIVCRSEEEVFNVVGLPYYQPNRR